MQIENHIFQGLRRDNHQIKQAAQFLWDAHNIRITNRDDSTLLSVTNERGPSETGNILKGQYVGHCTVGKYLIVFTAIGNNKHYIYRLEETSTGYKQVILYHNSSEWKYGWETGFPIEAIGIYETELIQKVYWVDGKNQPRVINVTKPELKGATSKTDYSEYYDKGEFDFVQALKLNESVSITKTNGEGMFSPGVIQYACTYYKKYGQETNIFYTSPLNYVSFLDRGGSPEDKVANSFRIEISNVDKSFDYIRLYSIHRTSIDAVPTVKRVTDIFLGDNNSSVSYVDDGTVGDVVDNNLLLYVGGEYIVPNTLCAKDGTLFLGNYKITRSSIPDSVKSFFKEEKSDDMEFSTRAITNTHVDVGDYYTYSNQLGNPNISYFRAGEHYRLGLQFQHESGKWSDPVVVKKDYTVPLQANGGLYRPSIILDGQQLNIPYFSYQKEERDITSVINTLKGLGYKKVRSVVCFPNNLDRLIIAQGILCPTVFNYYQRYNKGAHSQASWFLRPTYYGDKSEFDTTSKTTHPDGVIPEFRHYHTLGRSLTEYAEIQSNDNSSDGNLNTINDIVSLGPSKFQDEFLVDQSTLTFHSPNIEFDPNFANLNFEGLALRIVGIVPFTKNIGDIDIKTSTPVFGADSSGFIHSMRGSVDNGGKSLLMGPFYSDIEVIHNTDSSKPPTRGAVTEYAVYPWHRTGSLNSDYNRPVETGMRSAMLQTKKMSNLKYSDAPVWASKYYTFDNGITVPQLWSGVDGELLKVKGNSYIGNVETILTRKDTYSIVTKDIQFGSGEYKKDNNIKKSGDPISMKYKSTPHLVLKLESPSETEEITLPVLTGFSDVIKTDVREFVTIKEDGKESGAITVYKFKQEGTDTYSYDISLVSGSPIGIIGTPGPGEPDKYGQMDCWFYRAESVTGSLLKCSKITIAIGTVIRFKTTDGTKYYKVIAKDGFKQLVKDVTDSYVDTEPDQEGSVGDNKTIKITVPELPSNDYFGVQLNDFKGSYLYLAELYRTSTPANSFGGNSDIDIENNTLWIPAGDAMDIDKIEDGHWKVEFTYGDTFFQRYDCLKTYPYTKEDENQIVEIGSFMCETKVNIDGRYDRNRGDISNLNMTPQIFNLMNEVYSQHNNFFNYRILDEDYYKNDMFSHQIIWSTEKFAGMDIDPWTQITLATPLDMDGSKGAVTRIIAMNEALLCLQERAFSTILFNTRVQIPTTDGTPIEISNGYKVDGYKFIGDSIGCQNKWAACNTPRGVYFIDDYTDTLWFYNGELSSLSEQLGMKWWFQENHSVRSWVPQVEPNGLRVFYDPTFGDLYFTPGPEMKNRDALCYSEQLMQFVSQYSYGGTHAMFPFAGSFLTLRTDGSNTVLWKNFVGKYNIFYDSVPKRWDLTFISNDNPTYTKIFDTLDMRADSYGPDLLGDRYSTLVQEGQPFDFIRVSNEYQDTNEIAFNASTLRKKFRVWRAIVPRNKKNSNGRDRIRNPWAEVTLGCNSPGERMTILHDISMNYTV